MPLLPARPEMTVLFAHAAYQLGAEFARRKTGIRALEARSLDEIAPLASQAHVMCMSGLWRDEHIANAPHLAFVQSISAGINNFGQDAFRARGVRLASAQGANAIAVAEHAMALMLALNRLIPEGRDNQGKSHWRGMIANPATRERELHGQTLLIVGLGGIGQRLAALTKAFGMRVIGTRSDVSKGAGAADAVYADADLLKVLPQADIVALTCPLTPATSGLINAAALAAMKPGVTLINVARGGVVDEPAVIAALKSGHIARAGLDVTVEEPLPASSPLWAMPQVLITPHSAGETQAYEARIVDLLLENLGRLARGEATLQNQVV
jgi:phosphoglycerate dehydrogenase-like enzyme